MTSDRVLVSAAGKGRFLGRCGCCAYSEQIAGLFFAGVPDRSRT